MRIIFEPGVDDSPESQAGIQELVRRGCTYEGMHPGYLAIDIPPAVELMRVAEYLTERGV